MNFYFEHYQKMLTDALNSIDRNSISMLENTIAHSAEFGYPILVCGNGGSAAITEHMSCDHTKGVIQDTLMTPFMIPLQSNVSLCTAIANDIGYEHIFSKQIEWYPNTTQFSVLVVSSSGNSPNIINALRVCKDMHIRTMAMVGFDGGLAKELADTCVHVRSNNYGIVEDAHQIIMHSMAQSIRIKNTFKEPSKLKL